MNLKELEADRDKHGDFSVMQDLIREMNRSSQRIDEYNTEELYGGASSRAAQSGRHHLDVLYDEAWKSEDSDAASLKEVPLDYFDKSHADSGCDDAVTSAIAEVSKDFLAGYRASMIPRPGAESDESSHLSSDTDYKLIRGAPAYARYPETAAGLSDNDWNPYGTESDTNISPRLNSQDTPGSRVMSFNPPLHSTDLYSATPSSVVGSIPNTCTRMHGIEELSEHDMHVVSLKPDVTADFSTISTMSELKEAPYVKGPSTEGASDLNKTMRDAELEGNLGKSGKSAEIAYLQKELDNLKRSSALETGYNHIVSFQKDSVRFRETPECSYMSVMDRAKKLGIPSDIVDGKANKDVHRESQRATEISRGDTSDDDFLGKKVQKVLMDTKYLEKEKEEKKTMADVAIDYHTLQKDLQEIQDSLHHNFGSGTASTILARNAESDRASSTSKHTPPTSDNDGEIIPSTTTTPDKKKPAGRMAWDFAGDLATGRAGGYMEEVSLNTCGYSSGSQRQSAGEKQSYNSDGDDTRTSGSSDKVEEQVDHAAADQALAEMSEILRPHPQLLATAAASSRAAHAAGPRDLNSSQDVDRMLSDFRDQRRELESRYQQLSNPGLADKVYRILTSQDPDTYADGILSQVEAQEREDRARHVLGLHSDKKTLNFSSSDTDNPNTSAQSLVLSDDIIRRKLDLSGLSSADGSRLADKSSFTLPSSKGFSAFDGMTKFLSAQMAKASERTFNHSLEMHLPPQVTTCYPLFADTDKTKTNSADEEEKPLGATESSNNETGEGQIEAILTGHPEGSLPTATSSPIEAIVDLAKEANNNNHSPEDSDSSSGKLKEKYRPYRPPGSKDFYYTESDAASVADSVTTIESTHIGSDDAKGPSLPSTVLGSRKDSPTSGGIYAKHKTETTTLPPIQEKSISDDRDSDANISSKGSANSGGQRSAASETDTTNNRASTPPDEGIRVLAGSSSKPSSYNSRSVAAARRDAQWEVRLREQGEGHCQGHSTDETHTKFSKLSDFTNVAGSSSSYSVARQADSDAYRLTTRGFEPISSDVSDSREQESVSLRVRMTYTDDAKKEQQRHAEERREKLAEARDWRHERDRDSLLESERFGRTYSPSGQSRGGMSFSSRPTYQDDGPDSERRDARLSPAFHRALSSELRQAIEARSPLLSRDIERSLAQAPLEIPTRHRSPQRSTSSPPPTFLARERGQSPRHYRQERTRARSPSPPRSERMRSPSPPARASRPHTQQTQRISPTHEERVRTLPASEAWASPPRLASGLSPRPSRSPLSYLSQTQQQGRPSSPEGHASRRSRSASPGHERRYASPVDEVRPHLLMPELHRRVEQSSDTVIGQRTPTKSTVGHVSTSVRQASPHRQVERTLENMSSESEDTEIDREPLSRRAQMLTAALPQEQDVSPDIKALWERFRALNESNDSSMNSSRIEAVTDLLRNSSQHQISQYLKEREEYRIERQERAERAENDIEKRLKGRIHQHHMHSSSEDDIQLDHLEMLTKKEEERLKRRASKKKKGSGKMGEPGTRQLSGGDRGNKENVPHGLGDKNKENIPNGLFSIIEDSGPEQSPVKGSTTPKKTKSQPRQGDKQKQHVIDPYMQKLREKISKQRGKIDKQTLKELQRVEKLKKLERLLSAKTSGEISDETLAAKLDEVSATSTPGSNSSQESCHNSEDSTTAKDSSAEMHTMKVEKEQRLREMNVYNQQQQEMRRRKEFKSSSNGRVKVGRETDKNTNRSEPSKTSVSSTGMSDNSELKLLKLVRKGYLSPEEAYRIAVERAQKTRKTNVSVADVSSGSLSSSDDHSFTGRPHHLYSPYSRQDEFGEIRSYKHSPKIKQFSPPTKLVDDQAHASRFSRPGRGPYFNQQAQPRFGNSARSNSPGFMKKAGQSSGPALSLKSYSPPRPTRCDKPTRLSSTSPHRLHHRHHHQRNLAGERYANRPTGHRFEKTKEFSAPTPKGVSWKISMNDPPSKWEEPAGPGNEMNGGRTQTTSDRPTRQQLPLPERPPQSEEGEEPLQIWEKTSTHGPQGFWNKADHPEGIPQELWAQVVNCDALSSKANHWDVDPLMDRVQYILNKEAPAEVDHASGLTLQDAFLNRKQVFISRCRERQKRIALAREDRHLQECLRLEREAIFAEPDRPPAPNLFAHPVSDNLHHPKRRIFTKNEMRSLTERRYKKLQEVVQQKEKQKTEAEGKLNRLRAKIFNKKVQNNILRKTSMRRR